MNREQEIKELEEKLSKLKAEEEKLKALPAEYKLAERLHEKLCHHNHTDYCDWYYGSWEDPRYAQKRYLEIARNALKISDEETIIKLAEIL